MAVGTGTPANVRDVQSAQKGAPLGESDQMICMINNLTTVQLNMKIIQLQWGKWTFGPVPIPPNQSIQAFSSSGRQSSPSGTEGSVTYMLGENGDDWITITFNVPWSGDNSVTAKTFSPYFSATILGFTLHGSVESVTITVLDGRQ